MMGGRAKTRRKRGLPGGWNGIVPVLLGAAMLALVFVLLWPGNGSQEIHDGPVAPAATNQEPGIDLVEGGVHVRTGFVDGEGLMAVVTHCTACHSARLVTQNRMTREGWEQSIRWMQRTQNLWDLGENEKVILDYLAEHYAPEKKGRRQNLAGIEWYELEP